MEKENGDSVNKKLGKASELLKISARAHNELRSNINLDSNNIPKANPSCRKFQNAISNIIKGIPEDVEEVAEAIVHTANCITCLEESYILSGEKKRM